MLSFMCNKRARSIVLIFGLVFFSQDLVGQSPGSADSLKQALRSGQFSEFERLDLLDQILRNEQNRDSCIFYGEKYLTLCINISPDRLHKAYIHLGSAYSEKGDLEKALEFLFSALDHASGKMDEGVAYSNIGNVYSLSQDINRALFYERRAISLFKDINDSLRIGTTSISMGYHYYQLDNLDSAILYLNQAKDIFNRINANYRDYYWAYAEGNLALVQARKGDYNAAEEALMEAVEILDGYEDQFAICDYQFQLSKILFRRKEYSKAEVNAKKALQVAIDNGFKEFIRDGHQFFNTYYSEAGLYQKAHYHLTNYVTYQDSLTNANLIRKLADQRTQFEVGQKQAEVDLLTAQKKIQQLMLVAAIGFSLIVIILAAIIYKYYRDKNKVAKILEAQKLELERVNATKDKFFSIISHDLRGPVSSFFGISRMIKFLVKSKETDQLLEIADDIDQSVERLSSLLDNLLNWAMQQQGHIPNVPEKLEFRYLAKDLAATFKTMADSKKISLEVEVDETVQIWADRNMTMTIFRNLINNALKFTPEGGTVTLFASEKDGLVTAGVRDTGVGIPKEKLDSLFTLGDKKSTYGTSGEKGLGLGLQLVYEFVEINKGKIKVESEPGSGTTFTVRLPAFAGEEILQKIE